MTWSGIAVIWIYSPIAWGRGGVKSSAAGNRPPADRVLVSLGPVFFVAGGIAMLVLSRKNLESVVVLADKGVEPTLRVTVLEIKGSSVRLGFGAADKVTIHRSEVWEKICSGILPGSPKRDPPAAATA
jgi:carbon storage regulator CsrA